MNADRGMEDVRTLVLIQLVVINVLVKKDIHFTPTKNIAKVRNCFIICFRKMASPFSLLCFALFYTHENVDVPVNGIDLFWTLSDACMDKKYLIHPIQF